MKRKQIANKIKTFSLMLCTLFLSVLALGGCSTLTYSGEDYNPQNASLVQTNEEFYFSTYSKTSQEENITLRFGISKTPVPDVLVTYVQVENKSNVDDYVFYLKDLNITSSGEAVKFITTSNYVGAYQSSQAGALAAMSQATGTLGSIANIANSYQILNQTSPVVENQGLSSSDDSFKQIGLIADGISAHTINNSTVIAPNESKYFYLFLKDPQSYPIDINYKDLSYTFMVKGNANIQEEE